MAATVDNRPSGSGMPFVGQPGVSRIQRRVDFSATGMALIKDATMALLDVPAGSVVFGAEILVNTAQAAITDIDLGLNATGATNTTLKETVSLAATGYPTGSTDALAAPIHVKANTQLVVTNTVATTISTADVTFILIISYPKQ